MLELNDRVEGYDRAAAPRPKGKRKRGTKPAAVRAAGFRREVAGWAMFGVIFTSVLSAGLNGYANAQHSPVAWAGWLMGLAVPVIVLTLSKVAGEKWLAGQRWVGGLAGGSGLALLFLSVWHCANSIALLTGGGLFLAIPMAVAIDCGLVACEIALITERRG